MAKVQITEGMLKRAANRGKLTLGEYVVYKGILYMASFFSMEKREITLSRVKNVRGSGYLNISFEDLISKGHRLTHRESQKRYSYVY